MRRDLAYSLIGEASIDITIQTLLSGTHVNLHCRFKYIVPGESIVYWYYGDHCLGVADIARMADRGETTAQIWSGPLRFRTVEQERLSDTWYRRVRGEVTRGAVARGGRYLGAAVEPGPGVVGLGARFPTPERDWLETIDDPRVGGETV